MPVVSGSSGPGADPRSSTAVDDVAPRAVPLELVSSLTAEIAAVTRRREVAVFLAVEAGASWAEIGDALGVSAQAAHKRYRWLHFNSVTDEIWREPPLPA